MPRYRIHFEDGKTIDKDGATGTEAKQAAKGERRRELEPNHEPSHQAIRVVRVEELSS